MPNLHAGSHPGDERTPSFIVVACGMAMIVAANCAFIWGLAGNVSSAERILLMLAAAVLGGGVFLTIVTMHRIGKKD